LTLALREMSPPVPKKIGTDMVYNHSPFNTTGFQQVRIAAEHFALRPAG
jgi:hypothetical protein